MAAGFSWSCALNLHLLVTFGDVAGNGAGDVRVVDEGLLATDGLNSLLSTWSFCCRVDIALNKVDSRLMLALNFLMRVILFAVLFIDLLKGNPLNRFASIGLSKSSGVQLLPVAKMRFNGRMICTFNKRTALKSQKQDHTTTLYNRHIK